MAYTQADTKVNLYMEIPCWHCLDAVVSIASKLCVCQVFVTFPPPDADRIIVVLNTKVLHDSPCYGTLKFLVSGNELTLWEDGGLDNTMHELLIPLLC